jgi:hypothetical protein
MSFQPFANPNRLLSSACVLAISLLMGCATASVNWDKRIGTYSWDDAVAEFGPPDKVADLEGGVKAAEWIQNRSIGLAPASSTPSYVRGETIQPNQTYGSEAPPKLLRLSFTPDGKLIDWDRNY